MKITPLLTRNLLAASCLALAPLAVAQSPVLKAPDALPSPAPFAKGDAVWKLPVFKPSADKLKTVVEALQQILEKQNFERMNILISPEAEAAKVPALDLRNVTGPEALSLIASAASCELEPIRAPEVENGSGVRLLQPTIGYKLRSTPGTSRREKTWLPDGKGGGIPVALSPTATSQPSAAFGPGGSGFGAGGFGSPATAAPGTPRLIMPNVPQAIGEGLSSGGGVAFFGGSGDAGVGFGGGADTGAEIGGMSPSPVIQTRVYPLATVGASATFAEIEKTIEDVLATSGAPKDQVKLALHEKTNVLVVRGPAEAQAMVEQLLAALGKNNAGNTDHDATSKITTMTVRLEVMTAEMDRLRKQIAEVEAERRELEKEKRKSEDERRDLENQIRHSQDQAPQKSDRK